MDLSNQAGYWNRVAHQKTFTHPVDFSVLERWLPKDARVVDYGCGYGRVVAALHGVGYTNVSGYDTSRELIRRGRAAGVAELFTIDTAVSLPVADGTVDGILLFAVLTCIPANADQAKLIGVLRRKLQPGGILYISDYYLQEDVKEAGRYEYLNQDTANYGVFTLPPAATGCADTGYSS